MARGNPAKECKGASYTVKATRPGGDPNAHQQPTIMNPSGKK